MPVEAEVRAGAYVLDSHALLAFLQKEPGSGLVAAVLDRAAEDTALFLSIINLGEIVYITERTQGAARSAQIVEDVRRLPIVLCEATEPRVLSAAHLKAHHALSYADAFAVTLAQELQATLVSGDPEIRALQSLVEVLWVAIE